MYRLSKFWKLTEKTLRAHIAFIHLFLTNNIHREIFLLNSPISILSNTKATHFLLHFLTIASSLSNPPIIPPNIAIRPSIQNLQTSEATSNLNNKMSPVQPPLSTLLPPLICGTATFNNLYNPDASKVPTNAIIARALSTGITAFDTSPYYGPSEILLGTALTQPTILQEHPRESYHLLTKVGRIASAEFDYSPAWVRYSVARSLARLHTTYLDVVYCHDVEFVSADEVLAAVRELRRIRDTDGSIKYIGISGYPISILCSLAERVLRETGEPLDAVMSYAHFTLQNSLLATSGLERLRKAGVDVVPNASLLGMGLLRSDGIPVGGAGDFHPAPREMRDTVVRTARWAEEQGERLESVAIRWALDEWARAGAKVGSRGVGISVMGCSTVAELDETVGVWESVVEGFQGAGTESEEETSTTSREKHTWSVDRRVEVNVLAQGISTILGPWYDFAWPSPGKDYVNLRKVMGVMDELVLEAEKDGESKEGKVDKVSRLQGGEDNKERGKCI